MGEESAEGAEGEEGAEAAEGEGEEGEEGEEEEEEPSEADSEAERDKKENMLESGGLYAAGSSDLRGLHVLFGLAAWKESP